jgi:hypothetical protein
MNSYIQFPQNGERFSSLDHEHIFLEDVEPGKHSCPRFTFVTVAWCISRQGLWFSIEPIKSVSQFELLNVNKYAKYLPYEEYYKYVIDAKRKFQHMDRESWPEFGCETYLQTMFTTKIYRCIVLALMELVKICYEHVLIEL